MFHSKTRMLCLAFALFSYISLSALAEVRTCQLINAIPATGVNFIFSSAFAGSSVYDESKPEQGKVVKSVAGATFAVKLNPRLELSAWGSAYKQSTLVELQSKILVKQRANEYISIAPRIYNSMGSKSGGNTTQSGYEDRCSLNGFALPLIFTIDTKRNVLINLNAAFNTEWIAEKGHYAIYNHDTHQYERVYYTLDTVHSNRGTINVGLTAFSGAINFTPELGISFVDARKQGKLRFLSYGVSFGAKL